MPLVLPGVSDLDDACVVRLVRLLEKRDGVTRVHIVRPGLGTAEPDSDSASVTDEAATGSERVVELESGAASEPQLCLHYDPERVTLTRVAELAKTAGASISERFAHAIIPFRAITAQDGGRRIESALRWLPGVTAATVNIAGQLARVEYDRRRIDLTTIREHLAEAGAEPGTRNSTTTGQHPSPRRDDDQDHDDSDDDEEYQADHAVADDDPNAGWYARNRELAWSLTAGVLLVLGWVASRTVAGPGTSLAYLPVLLYAISYLFGTRDNVGHFAKDLRKGHFHFDIDLLMVVAATGAAILGQWVEGALLLFLFSLGHALEHYALGRARNAIKALAELAPSRAIVLRDVDGRRRETEVQIEDVRPGDLTVVKPAERIPVDGTVREGKSSVNQAPITGESMPVEKVWSCPDSVDTSLFMEEEFTMPRSHPTYPAAFREQLIELVRAGRSPAELAREFVLMKCFGDSLPVLQAKAAEVSKVISSIPGAADVSVDVSAGAMQVELALDRGALARYGLNVADVRDAVQAGIGGVQATGSD